MVNFHFNFYIPLTYSTVRFGDFWCPDTATRVDSLKIWLEVG